MKKVLFVATVTRHINSFHIPYLKWFKEQGYEIHVASNGNEEVNYCDKHFNLNFARFPLKIQNWEAYKQLKEIIKENQYEIIHCHTPVGGVLARLAAKQARKRYGIKVIYTAHGFHFFKGAPKLNWIIYYPIEKYLSKYTDCLITINKEDYERAKHKFKCRVEYIPGVGVDRQKIDINISEEEKAELRQQFKLKDTDFVMIIVGEYNKNKNQIFAINTMKKIVDDYKDIKLLLIGKGPQEEMYRQFVSNNNLEDNIKIIGYRKDIPKLLKISNVLLSMSYREGLPVNVMEAIISGIPVIATSCRGNIDLIIDGKNGYVVQVNDIQKLKDRILELYNNPLEISKEDAVKYELGNIISEYVKIYTSL